MNSAIPQYMGVHHYGSKWASEGFDSTQFGLDSFLLDVFDMAAAEYCTGSYEKYRTNQVTGEREWVTAGHCTPPGAAEGWLTKASKASATDTLEQQVTIMQGNIFTQLRMNREQGTPELVDIVNDATDHLRDIVKREAIPDTWEMYEKYVKAKVASGELPADQVDTDFGKKWYQHTSVKIAGGVALVGGLGLALAPMLAPKPKIPVRENWLPLVGAAFAYGPAVATATWGTIAAWTAGTLAAVWIPTRIITGQEIIPGVEATNSSHWGTDGRYIQQPNNIAAIKENYIQQRDAFNAGIYMDDIRGAEQDNFGTKTSVWAAPISAKMATAQGAYFMMQGARITRDPELYAEAESMFAQISRASDKPLEEGSTTMENIGAPLRVAYDTIFEYDPVMNPGLVELLGLTMDHMSKHNIQGSVDWMNEFEAMAENDPYSDCKKSLNWELFKYFLFIAKMPTCLNVKEKRTFKITRGVVYIGGTALLIRPYIAILSKLIPDFGGED